MARMKDLRKAAKAVVSIQNIPLLEQTGEAAQKHTPVLFREVLSFAKFSSGSRFLDGTLGLGGHSEGLLNLAVESGVEDFQLLGLDRDLAAISLAQRRLEKFEKKIVIRHSCYADFDTVLEELGWDKINFALIDIGVSSMQIDDAERGFSFAADGPLDMRMDTSKGQSAKTLVNESSVLQLKDIIEEYGEDPMAGRIARAIDDARAKKCISTTRELADIVEQAYPAKWRATSRNHPATRTFQALRMVVNDELGQLASFLQKVTERLEKGGRLVVISFHSLEDRLVKHFFREASQTCTCPRHVPVCVCGTVQKLEVLTRKPLVAQEDELALNPRASSAKLRVAERV